MPDISLERISRLIEHVYVAGLERLRWQAFCDTLAEAYPGAGVAMLGQDLRGNALGVVAAGYAPEYLRSFEQHYGAINPWAAVIAGAPVGVAVSSDPMFPRETLTRTEFYNDWLRPQDDLITGVGAVARSDGNRFLMLNFTMPDAVNDRHHGELELLCNLLGPHLRQSTDLTRQLTGSDFGGMHRQTLELAPSPVFVIDASGTLRFANGMGETVVQSGGIVTGSLGAPLGFVDESAQQRFLRSLDAVRRRDYSAMAAPFHVICATTHEAYLMTIAPYIPDLDFSDTPFGFLIDDRPVAILLLTPAPPSDPEAVESALRLRGLTRAERSLALAVHQGRSLQDYAGDRQLSIHTVRNQLRAIYDKLDVRRQSELAALMSRLAGTRPLEPIGDATNSFGKTTI